jgi:hypothetical protein
LTFIVEFLLYFTNLLDDCTALTVESPADIDEAAAAEASVLKAVEIELELVASCCFAAAVT